MEADGDGLPVRCLNCGGERGDEAFFDERCWHALSGAEFNALLDAWTAGARDFPRSPRIPRGEAGEHTSRLRASTPTPAPAPTGMEPGQRCTWAGHANDILAHTFVAETDARWKESAAEDAVFLPAERRRCPYVEPATPAPLLEGPRLRDVPGLRDAIIRVIPKWRHHSEAENADAILSAIAAHLSRAPRRPGGEGEGDLCTLPGQHLPAEEKQRP